jgi:putative membrane protein
LPLASGLAPAQSPKLTDPQIAHIAYTAGQIDIEAAELAVEKRSYGDWIATDALTE